MLGQHIGNYRLVRVIGEGGMGIVYEAVNDSAGGRAAIKILRPEVAAGPEIRARFFDEARAANAIAHSSVVRVFDCGYTVQGMAYLAMEYLDGESLKVRLERLTRLTIHESMNVARQIASALSAAHQQQIIHRDLKPDNIMLVPDSEVPGGERVKILDFGIAKITQEAESRRTRSNLILGTPMYMAPEQCHGAKRVTAKSDVYALGVIHYQMLVGDPPFQAEGFGELVAMHLKDSPPDLGQRAPHVPAALASLIHRQLAKQESHRPSMVELHRALVQIISQNAFSPTRPIRVAVKPAAADAAGVTGPTPQSALVDYGPVGACPTQPLPIHLLRQLARQHMTSGPLESAQHPDHPLTASSSHRLTLLASPARLRPLSIAESDAPTSRDLAAKEAPLDQPRLTPSAVGGGTITGAASQGHRSYWRVPRPWLGLGATLLVGTLCTAVFQLSLRGSQDTLPRSVVQPDLERFPAESLPGPLPPTRDAGVDLESQGTSAVVGKPAPSRPSRLASSQKAAQAPPASPPALLGKKANTIGLLIRSAHTALKADDPSEAARLAAACVAISTESLPCWWVSGTAACRMENLELVRVAVDKLRALSRPALANEVEAECKRKTISRGEDGSYHKEIRNPFSRIRLPIAMP